VVASEEALREAIDKYYGTTHALELKKVMEDLAAVEDSALEVLERAGPRRHQLEARRRGAGGPVSQPDPHRRPQAGASDIHIEPYEKTYRFGSGSTACSMSHEPR